MRSVLCGERDEVMTANQPVAPDAATAHIPYLWTEPRSPSGAALVAGATIASGRIRLLLFYGESAHLQFWQAADTVTGQHLAITVVDPENELPTGTVDAILSRTARLRGIDSPSVATVIDVGRDYCGGVVVSEWIRGATLKEVANTNPSPIGVADAVLSLAEATEAGHRAGLTLSVDHPARIRVSVDGRAVLAFPGTLPDATPPDDLRGIGAVMYALLVNRWPFESKAVQQDWHITATDAQGRIQEPAAANPRIPFLVSSTAAALVRDGENIRSAKTITTLLREASADAKNSARPDTTRERPALPPPGHYAAFGNFGPAERADYARRQLLKTCLGTAAAVVLVLLITFATTISDVVGTFDTQAGMNGDKLGLHPSVPPPGPSLVAANPAPVKVLKASVFSPGGAPDNPGSAGLATDGDPATAWSTDTYFDPEPFPKFKDGVGLLLQLAEPTTLSAVTVDLNSSGTVVQIRAASNATPAKVGDTTELSPPAALQPGHHVIPVTSSAATTFVLFWIGTLGTTGGRSHADISELTVQSAVQLR
jgi:hypothetical protein